MTTGDLQRLGIRIRCRLIRPASGWLFESLTATARRAVGVAILRRSIR